MRDYTLGAVVAFSILSAFNTWAKSVCIYNTTDKPVFAAVYNSVDDERVERIISTQCVEPKKSLVLEGDANNSLTRTSKLVIAPRDMYLKDTLSRSHCYLFNGRNVGRGKEPSFYVVQNGYRPLLYSSLEWYMIYPFSHSFGVMRSAVTTPLYNRLSKKLPAVYNNKYKDQVAQVRNGLTISPQEQEYLAKRMPVVKKACQQFTGVSLRGRKVPTIAFVCSGGGMRAAAWSMGVFTSAHSMGLMDAVTYIATVSGSAWPLSMWLSSGLPLDQCKERVLSKIVRGLGVNTKADLKLLLEAWLVKALHRQPLTLVDLYSVLVANTWFDDFGSDKQRIFLSQQVDAIKDGQNPFPIYTAIQGEERIKADWYEFNPYEISAEWLGLHIPSWAYGRIFWDGQSVDSAPELPLSYHLGVYGSAFAAPIKKIYKSLMVDVKNLRLKKVIQRIFINAIAHKRVTSGQINNFMAGMPESPLSGKRHIRMVDAGLSCNLPYRVLSGVYTQRTADILIFIDTTGGLKNAKQLLKSEEFARAHNQKFPVINYEGICDRPISVFEDPHDPTVPIVIYMPRVFNQELWDRVKNDPLVHDHAQWAKPLDEEKIHQKAFHMQYDRELTEHLYAVGAINMIACRDVLKSAIIKKTLRVSP